MTTNVYGIKTPGINSGVHEMQVQFCSEKDAQIAQQVFREGEQCLNTYYGAMLDAADSALNDAIHVLRTKKKWKFKLKHDVSRVKLLSEKTCKRLREGLKQDLYIDMLDTYQDVLEEDLGKLKESVVQALHKLGVEHARYKANFEVVNVLYGVAAKVYRDILEDVDREAKVSLSKLYTNEIAPGPIMKLWCNAMPLLVDYKDDVCCAVLKDKNVVKYMLAVEHHVSTKAGADEVLALVGYEHPDILKNYAEGLDDVDFDAMMEYAEKWYKQHKRK